MAAVPAMASCAAPASMSGTGFWMPEESQPHQRTFMQWPVSKIVHPDPVFLDMLQQSIADVANAIAEFESVVMLMDERFEESARRKLSDGIEVWNIPTDDLWCRDAGPCFVRNEAGQLAVRHFNFNGWGSKQVHGNDGKVAAAVADRLGLELLDNGLVGEPGGLESDGAGTVIAHESSWVIDNRNGGTKAEIEAKILEAVGGKKLIWAPGVKGGDITDYHIDALARFTKPGEILIQLPDEDDAEEDPFAASAYETHDILAEASDAGGKKFAMTVLPQPYDIRVKSEDFVASYVNYYVCNGAVIAAQFGDAEADAEAGETLQRLHPGREIVMLNVDPIGECGGGIHCATQQMPKV
ncbi:agmatine deiminase family protein [Parasphingorhabdus halotolerans]|uniref:Agmatine deiminase family protein n=2 Tax=Parasphingorhabdus halotolerans TaxID=2725558 RepID=A0A6H2DS60_9SPHN|nr:agmatine deiminase family protein [Parasphingorhabdus halotolerans]